MVRQRSTQGVRTQTAMDNDDGIVQVLSEHEHVIDCIVWAPTEACRTIDAATYSGMSEETKDGNEELNGDAPEEAKDGGASQQDTDGAATSTPAGEGAEDESRATVTTRLTTKERIQ